MAKRFFRRCLQNYLVNSDAVFSLRNIASMTELPPKETLRQCLHEALTPRRARLEHVVEGEH